MRAMTSWTILAVAVLLGCSGKVVTVDGDPNGDAGGSGGASGSGGVAGTGGSIVGGSGGGTAGTGGGAAGTAGAGGVAGTGGGTGATGGSGGSTGGSAGSAGGTGGSTGGSGGSTGGTGGATGGSGGSVVCPIDTGWPPCNDCIDAECGTECANCVAEPECNSLLECLLACQNQNDQCSQDCVNQYPGGINTILELVGQNGCVTANCGSACGSGGSGGTGGTGGTGGSASCPIQSGDAACDDCINGSCLDECLSCVNNVECTDLWSCIAGCNDDQTCINGCAQQYPNGINPLMALLGQDGCVPTQCNVACYGGTGGSGGTGGGGTGGTAGSGGSSTQCTLSTGDATCDACMNTSCLSQCENCAASPECVAMKECVDQCPPNDTGCTWQCAQIGGVVTYGSLFGQWGCLASSCANECP